MTTTRRYDLVVIGAGPAGLAAADAAAQCGKRVLLLDQAPRIGGQIWRHRDRATVPSRGRQLMATLESARISVAVAAVIIDIPSPDRLLVTIHGRTVVIETAALVLATGASERFLPFPGWTLPGVVGVGGLQALIKSGLDISGQRVVLAGSGPLVWPVAREAVRAGARVSLIAEQATLTNLLEFGTGLVRSPATLLRAVGYRAATWRAPFRTDSWVLRADGEERVTSAVMRVAGVERRFECDWLATAVGLVPRTALARLLGCALDGDAIAVDQQQSTSVSGVWAAGECTGISGDEGARVEGAIAGRAASGAAVSQRLLRRRELTRRFGARLTAAFAPRAALRERVASHCVVCRCEDVTAGAIDPNWDARQAKLWTRIGMGPCQGAVCGPACAMLYGWDVNVVRPPLDHPAIGEWITALRAAESTEPPRPARP